MPSSLLPFALRFRRRTHFFNPAVCAHNRREPPSFHDDAHTSQIVDVRPLSFRALTVRSDAQARKIGARFAISMRCGELHVRLGAVDIVEFMLPASAALEVQLRTNQFAESGGLFGFARECDRLADFDLYPRTAIHLQVHGGLDTTTLL